MNEKLKSAVYGLAVGDALGVPYEFKERGTFTCTDMIGDTGAWKQPKGTWSDDTSLTLATLDSLNQCGKVDVADIRKRFEDWFFDDKYTVNGVFDCGKTTQIAIIGGKGMSGKFSNGNGSLMRILPLAFFDCDDDLIGEVSAITHAHKISRDTCVKYIKIARELISGASPKEAVGKILSVKLPELIKSDGFVLNTFYASLFCLCSTDSYKDCVLKAVNLGDDTDTTAAVAGGLAGIVYGFDAIPKNWIEALRGKEIIDAVVGCIGYR